LYISQILYIFDIGNNALFGTSKTHQLIEKLKKFWRRILDRFPWW